MMKPNPITHHKIYFSEEEYTNDTLMSFNNFEKDINCLIKEVNLNLCQYSYAIENDNRNYCLFLWNAIKEKSILFRVFNRQSPYEMNSLNFCIFMLYLSIVYLINAICFTDDMIIHLYYNDGEPSLISSLIRMVISIIIGRIAYYLSKCVMIYPSQFTLVTKEQKKIYFYFKRYNKGILVFFIVLFSVLGFAWYYCTLFCIIYYYTQNCWFYTSCLSIIYYFLCFFILFTNTSFINSF